MKFPTHAEKEPPRMAPYMVYLCSNTETVCLKFGDADDAKVIFPTGKDARKAMKKRVKAMKGTIKTESRDSITFSISGKKYIIEVEDCK